MRYYIGFRYVILNSDQVNVSKRRRHANKRGGNELCKILQVFVYIQVSLSFDRLSLNWFSLSFDVYEYA